MFIQVRHYLIRGINLRLDSFPRGLHRKAVECTRRIFGLSIADPDLARFDGMDTFVRPEEQLKALAKLELSSWTPA